jgi:hypothetical protein
MSSARQGISHSLHLSTGGGLAQTNPPFLVSGTCQIEFLSLELRVEYIPGKVLSMRGQQPEHTKWQEKEHHRRNHRRPQTVEGEIGHWVRTAGILAPLIIGEFVKDPDRKWRFIRITSVAAAILSEGLHSHKAYRQRESDREALEACAIPGGLTPVS